MFVDYDKDNQFREITDTEQRSSKTIPDWCKCEKCLPMPLPQECLCCLEQDEIKHNIMKGIVYLRLNYYLTHLCNRLP